MTGALVRLLPAGRRLAVILAILAACPAFALHRESPPAIRLTSGGPNFVPQTRSWAFSLIFSSTDDLLANGSTGRQIYYFTLFDYDCQRGVIPPIQVTCPEPPHPFLVQLTSGPGDPDNPTIDGSGNRIAFDADGSYGGGQGAGHRQIFELDLDTGELLQVTAATDGDSVRPSINFPGGVVVFESTAALKGGTSGVPQVFAFFRTAIERVPVTVLLQITNGAGPSTRPMLDYLGKFISFESTADLLGDGHDTGVSQIFASELEHGKPPFSSRLIQITRGDAPSHHPWIAEKDHFVLFDSAATDLPGAAGGGGTEIYAAPIDAGNSPTVVQYTTANPFGNCTFPTFSPGTTRFAFLCTGDAFANGTGGNRVFAFDAGANQLFQITGRGDVVGPISAAVGLNFVAISDNTDVSGGDACDYQIYIIDYFPFPGHWIPATRPGQLPYDLSPPPPPGPNSNLIGTRTLSILPADPAAGGGSQATLTTQAGTWAVGVDPGYVRLDIAARDVNQEARIGVPGDTVILPPISFPGFGTFCIAASGDGAGALDCNGGRAGGDLDSFRDHNIDDTDPACVTGCREDGHCQGSLPGPHHDPALANPPSPPPAVCNGPPINDRTGTYGAGGMQLEVPVKVTLSAYWGVDGVPCTADDTYFFRDAPSTLALTTGSATGAILDAGNVLGATLEATDGGAPFDCARVKTGDLTGGELVGTLSLLDVPNLGQLTDVVLGLHLVAAPDICINCTCSSATTCGAAADCADADVCNGTEQCQNLTCVAGNPLPCDDGNPCTDDSCDPTAGCVHTNNTGPCDDGNPCTTSDTCQSGTCVGVAGANGGACDDGNGCTLGDVCQAGTCTGSPAPDGSLCDDGNPCTTGDSCLTGACTGGPAVPDNTPCSDGSVCNGLETCVGGVCTPGTALNCDDGNSCTADSCDPITGCAHTTSPDGTPCYDGNGCTPTDVCQGGACVGSGSVACPAAPCSQAICDPSNGTCSTTQLPDGAACEDGDACTTGDTCQGGTCVGGGPVACAPLDSCHLAGVCDPANGCSNPAKVNGTGCDDGSACTLGDVCLNGVCSGVVVSCDDGDPCNGTETCDPASGGCVTGPLPNCDDGDPCTTDSCVAFTGCTHQAAGAFACGLSGIEQTFLLLQQDVQAAPVTALGGQSRQTRLLDLVARGLARVESARSGPARLRAHQLQFIQSKLKFITNVIDAGMRRLKIDPRLGGTLRSLAVGAMRDVQSLRASIA